jgi:hypothetical protein
MIVTSKKALVTPGAKVSVPLVPTKCVPETAVLYIEPLPPTVGPPD